MKVIHWMSWCCLGLIGCIGQIAAQPLDDIVDRKILQERSILAYPPLREADLFWEKRVWRVIDLREKMNQAFRYPVEPFFNILREAAEQGEITLYSTENDRFTMPMDAAELQQMLYKVDTIEVFHPVTLEPQLRVIQEEINWESITRFRIKEQWFFETATSTLRVRILGIAPIIEVRDDQGNFRHERPLFWAYYPELRPVLAKRKVFHPNNDQHPISWEDQLERRFFSSYIYKQSNVQDDRLEATYSGLDLLLEADKIKQEIFNFEHDLWSY
ncbi:MAG: gliding motility protein GldN [Bacteroidota bacterium]